ncbi:GMC oxidoreductase-domain-containing protein [Armillaria luteobubalina]|uniref:GMC oxidoreductase-domain-containing protein n=1 Tax=Armillaria luteobubalina TaxID=153913 RepID=A0AA39PBK7_9AGAR|nr:GMC oxidoreductase-domain-containing protein [Armillaria luteobubalina]
MDFYREATHQPPMSELEQSVGPLRSHMLEGSQPLLPSGDYISMALRPAKQSSVAERRRIDFRQARVTPTTRLYVKGRQPSVDHPRPTSFRARVKLRQRSVLCTYFSQHRCIHSSSVGGNVKTGWFGKEGGTRFALEGPRMEVRQAETYEDNPTRKTHGSSEIIKASFGGNANMMETATQSLEIGLRFKKIDQNLRRETTSALNQSVYSMVVLTLSMTENAKHHYLYISESKNLSVFDGTRVKRVIFEGTRAVGVEYVFDKQAYPDAEQTVLAVRASRIVVVSAGATGSSLILEQSGIDAASILGKFGIKQVVDLPGVGNEYDDHPFLITPYTVDANAGNN